MWLIRHPGDLSALTLVISAENLSRGFLGPPAFDALLRAPAQSPFVPLAVMQDMHARLPGSELQVFADARHGLPCSHGVACARALRSFLDRRGLAR